MIESLRTTQIAFFRFATSSGFLGGWGETGYKKYSCKGPCKGKSYETICENIVSRYQTLVSFLPRGTVFLHRRPKTELKLGSPERGSPVINHLRGVTRNRHVPLLFDSFNSQLPFFVFPHKVFFLYLTKKVSSTKRCSYNSVFII